MCSRRISRHRARFCANQRAAGHQQPDRMAEWDAFVAANQWTGGFALNVKTRRGPVRYFNGRSCRVGARVHSRAHGISLLMSDLDNGGKPAIRAPNVRSRRFRICVWSIRAFLSRWPMRPACSSSECPFRSRAVRRCALRCQSDAGGGEPAAGGDRSAGAHRADQKRGEIIADNGGWKFEAVRRGWLLSPMG